MTILDHIIKTATPALVTGIISVIVFAVKYNYDSKSNFDNLLKEKLEKVYTPLYVMLRQTSENTPFFNDELSKHIKLYGHLLPKEILNELMEVYRLERVELISIGEQRKKEYNNLRYKILKNIERDFNELHKIYNENFFEYKKSYSSKFYVRWASSLKKACIISTSIFYIMLIGSLLLSNIKVENHTRISNNDAVNILIYIYTIVILLTSFYGCLYILSKCTELISKKLERKSNYYQINEWVQKTGVYKCTICGSSMKLYKNIKFPNCSKCSTKQKVLRFFLGMKWKAEH